MANDATQMHLIQYLSQLYDKVTDTDNAM